MTCADMSCNCKYGHQQAGGEASVPPVLQANGQDGGEGQQEEPEELEVEEARTG